MTIFKIKCEVEGQINITILRALFTFAKPLRDGIITPFPGGSTKSTWTRSRRISQRVPAFPGDTVLAGAELPLSDVYMHLLREGPGTVMAVTTPVSVSELLQRSSIDPGR
ncbi:hypothetical protein AVEN_221762-1 [Araneus ventricosus]|uniref:Uncharacterized protein n=1 Tax=Araneus ventricosus TaxID=182803 RepID=A0A4Y2FN81_ARAVE|nr:hypothetical protein AVEN_221762-1 [Araneus ventricosus]